MKIKDKKSVEIIREYIKELQQDLESGASERLVKYLEFVGNFRNYSFYNTLLIWAQCPNATYVAGFKTWNKLGYRIKKGERAIRILAPRFYKYYEVDGKMVFVNEGDEVPEDIEVQEGIYFVGVNVFDISQTEKTPEAKDVVDNIFYPLGNSFEEKYYELKRMIEKEGIVVEETDTGRAEGFALKGRIAIKKGNDYNNKLLTLIHEYAHIMLHFDKNNFTREEKEVQAEAVSYLVGRYIGLNNPFASDYILLWGKSVKTLKDNLKVVVETAGQIVEKIRRHKKIEKAA